MTGSDWLNKERKRQRGESESEAEKEAESFRHFSELFFFLSMPFWKKVKYIQWKDDMCVRERRKKKSCGEHSLFRWFGYIWSILQIRPNIRSAHTGWIHLIHSKRMQTHRHRSMWNSVIEIDRSLRVFDQIQMIRHTKRCWITKCVTASGRPITNYGQNAHRR